MQVDIVMTLIQYSVTKIRFYRLMTDLIFGSFRSRRKLQFIELDVNAEGTGQ